MCCAEVGGILEITRLKITEVAKRKIGDGMECKVQLCIHSDCDGHEHG